MKKVPVLSLALLGLILSGCLFAGLITGKDPSYLDLANVSQAPGKEFPFGTDALGRDIFSGIWHGGRVSLFIGCFATAVSTLIALAYGSFSGIAPDWLDVLLMRLTEVFLSIPGLLTVLFIQAAMGEATALSVSLAIGLTGWYGMARMIRTEVKQMKNSEYLIASRCMGGSFFHILRRHVAPNLIAPLMFMVVMNIRTAIVYEATLSFLGMGLPLDVISWGSMLSLAENAVMTGNWWIILIPGGFLLLFLLCLTNAADWLLKNRRAGESCL